MAKSTSFHPGSPPVVRPGRPDERYADPRPFLDAGGRLVLASNCNPGSSPTSSMPLVAALGRRQLGLGMSETLTAITSNPADLLDLPDRGRIATDMRADLVLLGHQDVRQLAYELGGNPVDAVICGEMVSAHRARETGRSSR
jgi:imidazolonepropionase